MSSIRIKFGRIGLHIIELKINFEPIGSIYL